MWIGQREENKGVEEMVKIEYHMFPKNTYCSGSAFVAKSESEDEDDGWIITFVHNEDTNQSQVINCSSDREKSKHYVYLKKKCFFI